MSKINVLCRVWATRPDNTCVPLNTIWKNTQGQTFEADIPDDNFPIIASRLPQMEDYFKEKFMWY